MKISIVTPTFNSESYIRDTMLSVSSQSYKNFEHIVVDGLSQDRTAAIVKEFHHATFISEKDKGQSDAINKGLKMATGDILAWQNADDLYFDNAFQSVVDFFQKNPETDIVYGYYQLIDSNGQWICDVYPRQWSLWMFAHGRFCPMQPTVFWRRRVSDVTGHLDESLHYCMDVDFFSRIAKHGFKFARIPTMLGKFRVHPESKTHNSVNENKVAIEYKNVLSRNFDYTYLDSLFFRFFQQRARIAKSVKQQFLKKM